MARRAARRPRRRALTKSPNVGDKQALRERVWALLTRRRLGRFPFPLSDRIPNFRGAEAAATRLTTLPEWAAARRLKCNPDAAQLPVRRAALAAGKHVLCADGSRRRRRSPAPRSSAARSARRRSATST